VRQLDVLSEVVKAVDGRCEVYLDGGIRTGSDVFKALALGAKVVFIGRPVIYGLAYNVRLLLSYDAVTGLLVYDALCQWISSSAASVTISSSIR